MKKQPKQAFTLIELLTVIAIIGILASILIPTVGRVRDAARRSVDGNNIRQIGQSAMIYANDNRELLPQHNISAFNAGRLTISGTSNTTLPLFAAALAVQGGLNDAPVWFSASDSRRPNRMPSTVLDGQRQNVDPDFLDAATNGGNLAFQAWSGLNLGMPASTPIAVTRGIRTDGYWDEQAGVYGRNGGHIVFLGGNVDFRRDLIGDNRLTRATPQGTETRTTNILATVQQGLPARLLGISAPIQNQAPVTN